jgi:hypothetical protein
MLRKLAVALVATSLIAAPALARVNATQPAAPAKIAATSGQTKHVKTAKAVKHVKKNKRHSRSQAHRVTHGKHFAARTAKAAPTTRAN